MSKSSLQLRTWPAVAFAYVAAPLAALTIVSIGLSLQLFLTNRHVGSISGIAGLWLGVVETGLPPCVLVELVVVTPTLIAFRRYRWTWLNGRLACATGFLTGAISGIAILGLFGWNDKLINSAWLMFGASSVGLIIALIFRLLAVRTVATS
jgi:hypothetical protein